MAKLKSFDELKEAGGDALRNEFNAMRTKIAQYERITPLPPNSVFSQLPKERQEAAQKAYSAVRSAGIGHITLEDCAKAELDSMNQAAKRKE